MKYVLGSPAWLAALHGIIVERAAWELKSKPKLSMAICEVFLNAPPSLANAEGGKIVWSCVIAGDAIDFQLRERDDVQLKIMVDHEAVLPLGRYDSCDDPAREAELNQMAADLIRSGKMQMVGEQAAGPQLMTSIHDAIARLTQ